jgi:serine/threonine protein phosphatase PrpC
MGEPNEPAELEPEFELALHSDIGNGRTNNEDFYGHWIEGPADVLFVVADGVGGYEGGEIASSMAVETVLEAYRDSPAAWGPAKRLHRAVQRANIEIYNRAITVPELRRMATTLTAAVVNGGTLNVSHVGDCRLYLLRGKHVQQLTRDHTAVGERVRMGLMSAQQARNHPERSALNRCLGHELIVSVDRISMTLVQGDRLVLCSDGLYSVIEDHEFDTLTHGLAAQAACHRLIEEGVARGTIDNLTAAFFRMNGDTPFVPAPLGLRARLRKLFGRGD